MELAALRGWVTASFSNTVKIVRRGSDYRAIADKGAAGFPDVVFLRPPRVVFAELKTGYYKPTEAQLMWLDGLRGCGQEVYLWRPEEWSEIEDVLG